MMSLVFAGLLQASVPTAAVPPVKTIERGQTSQQESARQAIARAPAEWAALWRTHAADRQPPAVDFAKTMVAAVFLGTRPTAGYSVEIVGTRDQHGSLVVEYVEKRPGPGAITAQMLTSPFHIVTIPAHAGPVGFEKVER